MKKTNEQYLRECLEKIKGILPEEGEEAIEFFDALVDEHSDELIEKSDEISKLKEEVSDLENEEPDEAEYENTEELGLDTFHWKLESGNLIITELVENFVESVKKK